MKGCFITEKMFVQQHSVLVKAVSAFMFRSIP